MLSQAYFSHFSVTMAESLILQVLFILFCVALLCILMGKRRFYNPQDYHSVDIEATSEHVGPRSSSSEHSSSPGRLRGRRRTRRRHPAAPEESLPKVWLVCPCRNCARSPKARTRLYSTVVLHIHQHLMSDKFKVCHSSFGHFDSFQTYLPYSESTAYIMIIFNDFLVE
jgi:hypothetical protein